MKRMIACLMLFLCVSGFLLACSVNDPTDSIINRVPDPTEAASTIPNAESDISDTTSHTTHPNEANPTTAPSGTDFPSLPEYEPGSILLEDQNYDDYDFERKYRITYYRIWGEFLDLIAEEQVQDFYVWAEETHKQTGYGATQNTMFLADFVKRYHISRTDFDQAVNEFIINSNLDQYDIIPEEYEPPNADIIYTFDDEIINEYYRYEKPGDIVLNIPNEGGTVYVNEVVPTEKGATNWLGLGEFTTMTKPEVLDYFGISVDFEDILSDYSLKEIPTPHGFHSTLAGNLLPHDAFIYHGEGNEMSVVISFRDQTVPKYKLFEPAEKVLHDSTIDGSPVMIFGWHVENVQAYRYELEVNDALCAVETRGMSLIEGIEIVKTLLY